MSLDFFENIPSFSDEKLHPRFKDLRDLDVCRSERNILKQWADGFVDRDNKVVKEFQITFVTVLWEIFLHNFLRKNGFSINYSHERPDFIIDSPCRLYIEAVVSREAKGSRKETSRKLSEKFMMCHPIFKRSDFEKVIDGAAVRNFNSIKQKAEKYRNEYLNCSWVDKNIPYVVALASYDNVSYGSECVCAMILLLFGFRFNFIEDKYSPVDSIAKPNSSISLPVGIFRNDQYSDISAIIFSCTVTLGKLTSTAISQGEYEGNQAVLNIFRNEEKRLFEGQFVTMSSPEDISDGVFIFHNPYAKNPVDCGTFSGTNIRLNLEEEKIEFINKESYLVQRMNIFFKGMNGSMDKENSDLMRKLLHNFNTAENVNIRSALERYDFLSMEKFFEENASKVK